MIFLYSDWEFTINFNKFVHTLKFIIMKLKFNKFFFTIVAFIFGFSGTAAAQYGIVENHYSLKGNVISEKCKNPVPKIKVKLNVTDNYGKNVYDSAYTDEKGNFSLMLITSMMSSSDKFEITAEDIDGKVNNGEFLPARQTINLNNDDFILTKKGSWDNYYDSKTIYYMGMKSKQDTPCK